MPPHNLFDSDCEAVSMGQLFNSLLSSSLNTLSPMCNDSASGPRVYSPTYPMNDNNNNNKSSSTSSSSSAAGGGATTTTQQQAIPSQAKTTSSDPNQRRPPLTPIIKPKTSYRNRKKVGLGLSIDVPPPSSPVDNRHQVPRPDAANNPPPLISCARNVEMRRKTLSERHFFRPVSEDDESLMGKKQ